MKRILVGILSAAALLSVETASVFAADLEPNSTPAEGRGICGNAGIVCSFPDADGDGLCDSYELRQTNGSAQNHRGGNFTDADSDGLCDSYALRQTDGSAQNHRGGNFTDADSDGFCHRRAPGQGARQGQGDPRGRNK